MTLSDRPHRELWIPCKVASLNELIAQHHHQYAKRKKAWNNMMVMLIRSQDFGPITEPSHFEYEFLEENMKRDPSNFIASGIKFIEDGFQAAKVLPNDSWRWIRSIKVSWKVGVKHGILVKVTPDGKT